MFAFLRLSDGRGRGLFSERLGSRPPRVQDRLASSPQPQKHADTDTIHVLANTDFRSSLHPSPCYWLAGLAVYIPIRFEPSKSTPGFVVTIGEYVEAGDAELDCDMDANRIRRN